MKLSVGLLNNAVVRQLPIAVIFLIAAFVGLGLHGVPVTSMPLFGWSMVLMAAATALAVVAALRQSIRPLFAIVPAIDFVAIAFLRSATGQGASAFTALMVLAVLWLGSLSGRRHIYYAVIGIVIILLAPLVLVPGTTLDAPALVRLAVTMIVYSAAAVVVNVLAEDARLSVQLARREEDVVQSELDRAADVQRSLLPTNTAVADGVDVAGACLPAKSVGGDFFDWYATDDGMALTLGDVMGKGVGAGLIAAAVRAAVRSAHSVDDPSEALLRAADGLEVARAASDVTFTTLFHARLSNDGVLRWADAGHGLTAILRVDGTVERLVSQDLPLGIQVTDTWKTRTTRLEPSEVLVTVSDGVLDLFDDTESTIERVSEIARGNTEPAAIVAALTALAEQVPHDDDVTIVAVRREPVREPIPA
ncbi:hypothetical protein GCM10022286_12750 [Gryllotalpicola daejeonensis]|uniref:PPM-type phosphatase domain-containing protein n=1 Tax=Gryllotalpicola daejeonensis TaxID=993087 RepID=A0ABP7ZI83_9MICO